MVDQTEKIEASRFKLLESIAATLISREDGRVVMSFSQNDF